MNTTEFVKKWSQSTLSERSSSQQHFLDLCALADHATPAAQDPTGESFTFEKGIAKSGGGQGWADVWKRGFFAWEYKGKHKDLEAAYQQLLRYREDLENPPLLIVCDMERLIIRTNFTNTPTTKYEIALNDLALDTAAAKAQFERLRDIFHHPERFKPGETIEEITERAASALGRIAQTMGQRYEPTAVARFLDRIVFCLFAEDIDLLPPGLFSRLLEKNRFDPARCSKLIADLFLVMAVGGDFGEHSIRRFNGNLFNEDLRFELTQKEVDSVRAASRMDWKNVDPSIFGTLFERGLDPEKRSQLGAHYTGRADIELLIEPVVLQPLRRAWQDAQTQIEAADEDAARELVRGFLARLAQVRVLDPACGSGNFLYVALQKLKHLEKSVLQYAADRKLGEYAPLVSPEQLFGIELNPYAFDLAQTTVWIGYLQWLRDNGYLFTEDPVLRKTDNFRCMDAVLDARDESTPQEPSWPEVDFIVGNPPFLGDKLMRAELSDDYVDKLRKHYAARIPGQSDFCCYWFEKARQQIADGKCQRAGLLATQGIRGGANHRVLQRIKESGDIFFAESDRAWILNGANVHISMVGFDDGAEDTRLLDGQQVASINANLTAATDLTSVRTLPENKAVSFIGVSTHGPFDLNESAALALLESAGNPNGRPNSDVVRPIINAMDIVREPAKRWVISFPADMNESVAALYQGPFEYILKQVKPIRDLNKRKVYRDRWWIHGEARPAMQQAIADQERCLLTPRVSKHRIFIWASPVALPSDAVVVFARDDDYFFGVLQSRLHEVWALKLGTRLETRPRYTPTTCFETFPFPHPTPEQRAAIAEAAGVLCALRDNWLNPPEWTREEVLEFPGSVAGPWARYVHDANAAGIGTVRYPRRVAKDPILAKNLVKRTLTNLYNERPAWLENAHRKLDAAVCAAYGWEPSLSDDEILEKLLALNLSFT